MGTTDWHWDTAGTATGRIYVNGGTLSGSAITICGNVYEPKPKVKPLDTALAWLDRRVDEMRVAL